MNKALEIVKLQGIIKSDMLDYKSKRGKNIKIWFQ